jgi:uncharacterized protein (DUF934 family)
MPEFVVPDSQASRRLRYRQDSESVAPIASFADFAGDTNATAVRLEPGDDARDLIARLGQLSLVEITFPAFRDGRGYSAARILREAGYTGELRAAGDVLVDQLPLMRRCGFDAFVPNVPLDDADVAASLARYDYVYQAAADDGVPIWKLRHG